MTLLHLKERITYHDPASVKQLLMIDHLDGDLPLSLLAGALARRMSFLRLKTSLLVACTKYPRIRLSHKTISLTGSCILLTIEMRGYPQHPWPDPHLEGFVSSVICLQRLYFHSMYQNSENK